MAELGQDTYPLHPFAEFLRVLHDELGCSQIVFRIPLSGCLDQDRFIGAIQVSEQRFPKLRARLSQDARGRAYLREGGTSRPVPVEFCPCESQSDRSEMLVLREISQQMLEPLRPYSDPMYRVKVLQFDQRNTLLFTIHHSIVDGSSMIRLLHQLFTDYQALSQADGIDEITLSPADLRPSDPSLFKQNGQMSSVLRRGLSVIRNRIHDLIFPVGQRLESDLSPREFVDRETGIQGLQWQGGMLYHSDRILSQTQTDRWIDRCKREGTTVHGALCAAALLALSDCYGTDPHYLLLRSPVDLHRRRMEVGDEDIDCAVSSCGRKYRVHPSGSLWDLARTCSHDIRQFIDGPGIIDSINVFDWLMSSPRRRARWVRRLRQKSGQITSRKPVVVINNLGRVSLQPRYGDLQVEGLTWFVHLPGEDFPPPYYVRAITLGGRLHLSSTGRIGLDRFTQINTRFHSLLRSGDQGSAMNGDGSS